MITTTCEKIAQEIRHLQRTEIQEVEEPFFSSQKGSSAMPHKRNPIVCERICGLARIVRSNVIVGLENIPLWGERDLSNSAPERIIIPESTILTHYIVRKTKDVVKELKILYQNISKNLNLSKGMLYSGRLLVELMKKGMSRKEAYQIVQENSFKTIKEGKELKEILKEENKIKEIFKEKEIEELFDGGYFLKYIDHIYKRIGITEG
jgi:adenylosuccinate lyase